MRFEGFTMTAGVRQGCPLSPTLFALAIDPLLHSLRDTLPEATVRAFADDIAILIPDIEQHFTTLHNRFVLFADYSHLHVNPLKSYLIPTRDITQAAHERIKASLWSNIQW